jgi:hypothetical protein
MTDARCVLAFIAIIAATPILACPKIEYAEAKDWPSDELQRQYCTALAERQRATEAAKSAPDPRTGLMVLHSADNCLDQAAMYERIFKNVHKMDVPKCQ